MKIDGGQKRSIFFWKNSEKRLKSFEREDKIVTINEIDKSETIVSNNTHLKGEINVEGDLHIYGHVEASVKCNGEIFIHEGGRFDGEMISSVITVSGAANGVFECNHLSIKKSGVLSGTTTTDELDIQSGGTFRGDSQKREYDNVTKLKQPELRKVAE